MKDAKARRKTGTGQPDLLRFAGDTKRPEPLHKLAERSPFRATVEPPNDFLEFGQRQKVFVSNPGGKAKKPIVSVGEIKMPGGQNSWQVDIKAEASAQTKLYGVSAERHPREYYAKETKGADDFSGFRPEWSDQAYFPNVLQETPRFMRRFNGRIVRPNMVFGGDGRQVFQNANYPWGCVGRIVNSDGRAGTAALIANNAIVTAAHLVPSGAFLGFSWWVEFTPAFYDGTSLHGAGFRSFCTHCRTSEPVTLDDDGPCGYDWAVFKLVDPLGDWLGWFGYNGYTSEWEDEPYWTIVGYPGAVAGGQRPSWQTGIRVRDDDSDDYGGRELEHRGDTTDGNSGGPMFSWWNGDPRLIGVISGTETDYGFPASFETLNVAAGGSGFTDLCRWARQNW